MKPGARPIGYLEIQKLVPPEGAPGRGAAIDSAIRDATVEAQKNAGRPMELYSSRLEQAGHNCLLYIGFQPVVPEGERPVPPLNPRNMNGAEQRVLGHLVHDANVGFKEARFGMGTPVAIGAVAPGEPIKSS